MNATAKTKINTRTLVSLAMLSTIAYLLVVVFRIPIVAFLKYEPKDVAIAIAGLLYGPLPAIMVSFVVSFIEMITISSTGLIGLFMNVLASCAFVLPAAILYPKKQNFKGAILGLVLGVIFMTTIMLLWNYLITPFYLKVPRSEVALMLLPVFLPFNILKGAINAALVVLLYKPLVKVMRKTGLVPTRAKTPAHLGKKSKVGVLAMFCAVFILVSCIMLILAINGKF